MKNLMIVGGTGFLGYYSALEALKRGYKVASLSLDDINLEGWYPKEIDVHYGDVFEMSEEELTELFKGFDYLIYSVGPDDRVTPKAPSYDFFHERLVVHPTRLFTAARKAGIKKAVVFNSYFATFDRMYPEKKIGERHPYVRSRLEQAKSLIEAGGDEMEVVVLELPYIFGAMPERTPLWKDVFIERFFKGKFVFFPKGGTTMIHVKHIGEAAIGAIENGKGGERYPIGDLNESFDYMLRAFCDGLHAKKIICHANKRIAAWGANQFVAKPEAKKGNQAGLDFKYLMLDIMSENMFIPEEEIVRVSNLLGYERGGVYEGIIEAMEKAYPNGYPEKKNKKKE